MKRNLHVLAGVMPVLALSGALLAGPVFAQGTPTATRQAQAWSPAASVPALQARMKSIRETTDPERRMALMEEQIQALDAASKATSAGCPMSGPMAGPMGGQMKGARGPTGAPGSMGGMMMDPKVMNEHMRLMQQHMKMMEQMMGTQSAPAQPAPN
ncbi:MAG: hypothetical protein EYC67_13075 [Betaproteobacteria bacterium]|nr:MAG: hypothetical protein EYC67_13075 [Betaproteobacteria bacterium]